MLHMACRLVSTGYAYAQRGSVYFNLSAFPSYGQLVSRHKHLLPAARELLPLHRDKAHPHDFALWKATPLNSSSSSSTVSWDSPFGPGRPGQGESAFNFFVDVDGRRV